MRGTEGVFCPADPNYTVAVPLSGDRVMAVYSDERDARGEVSVVASDGTVAVAGAPFAAGLVGPIAATAVAGDRVLIAYGRATSRIPDVVLVDDTGAVVFGPLEITPDFIDHLVATTLDDGRVLVVYFDAVDNHSRFVTLAVR